MTPEEYLRGIEAKKKHNLAVYQRGGYRLSTDYQTWIAAKSPDGKYILWGGLGGAGRGEMWVRHYGQEDCDNPEYALAPVRTPPSDMNRMENKHDDADSFFNSELFTSIFGSGFFRYYRRDGTAYPQGLQGMEQYALDRMSPDLFSVRQETLPNGYWVSTVWLGLDHNHSNEGPPIIFETMVVNPLGDWEEYQERYATEEEAILGHIRTVDLYAQKPSMLQETDFSNESKDDNDG